MTDFFQIKNPIYPVFTILSSVMIFAGALILARSISGIIFLSAVFILLCFFGYFKTCLKILPFLTIYCGIFFAIFYFASHKNAVFAGQMAVRLCGVLLAFIPGLSMPPVNLVRCMTELNCPRLLTLGMLITLTFIPVLNREITQIRNAMKTRGATTLWKPVVLYRAILIPLIVRLVNISDNLSLSVETRAFINNEVKPTVYKKIRILPRDIIFAVFFMMIFILCLSFYLVTKK